MKTKRTTILILVVVMASLLMVAAVSADTIVGTGWIRAHGDGSAAIEGYAANITISGNGTLWYKDEGEEDTPTVTGEGVRIEYPGGWVQYVGFHGTFSVEDADQITVILDGFKINLFAAGRGVVHLRGHGGYTVGHGSHIIHGNWAENGRAIEFGSSELTQE